MVASPGCFVCRKHRGEEPVPGGPIYEDALVYRVDEWPDAPRGDAAEIEALVARLSARLTEEA